MQPTLYRLTVDALRLTYTGDAAIEYRLRIFEPQSHADELVVVCTHLEPVDAHFVAALAYEVLGESSHPGPWIWLHQQEAPQGRGARPRSGLLRLLVLVRDAAGMPMPYSRTWTVTNRSWIEELLAQPLDPPEFKLKFKVQRSKLQRVPGTRPRAQKHITLRKGSGGARDNII